jgi:hypothetical protein
MEYKVYFELCGYKLKQTVEAVNASTAKKAIQDKLIFHKIVRTEKENKENKTVVEELMKIFGMK